PAASLWKREVVRFLRQRNRVVGALGTPLLFWLLLGSGYGRSFQPAGVAVEGGYLAYFFPGSLVLILFFTAIYSTISIIEDRREGFLQSVLVAPVPRSAIVAGKILGGTTVAMIHAVLFLLLVPSIGIRPGLVAVAATLATLTLIAFGLTGLGFLIAWRMESTQGFHAIMNLVLMPMWMLSGSLFPISGAAGWLGWVMRLNPLTYGVEAVRTSLHLSGPPAQWHLASTLLLPLAVTAAFCVITFAASTLLVGRRSPESFS
ncbi:MAG: ABC transporter permease, partial [Acidobacteriota bacterium]